MQEIDRIVVLHDYSTPRGGASALAVEAVRQYRALGLNVTMFTGEAPNAELQELGAETLSLNEKPLLELPTFSALRQGYHRRSTAERLSAWIAENDTPRTVYHLNNWSQILSPSIFLALRRVADRTLITCHDYFNSCPNGAFLHFGKSEACALKPLSLACTLSQCDRRSPLHKAWRVARQKHVNRIADFTRAPYTFAFIHEHMAERFQRAGFTPKDTITIRNPVTPWCDARIEAEANSGFLFVGRIGRDKGADIALAGTEKSGQGLTLIGTGELAETGAANDPHARFVGWKSKEEIAVYAKQARALIVPSRVTEPFGLVILEAAMSGLPVIISDRAALSDEISENSFGESFSPADVDGLAGIIDQFASDDDRVRQVSEAGFQGAAKLCHTPQSWAAAHVDVFQRKIGAQAKA